MGICERFRRAVKGIAELEFHEIRLYS
jgi:hypothetical protein